MLRCELEIVEGSGSPIEGWNRDLVMTSLRNHASGGLTTASLTGYPITLRDMKRWVLDEIVSPFLSCATEYGLILQGQTGIGKTPLARALAMAISQYHIDEDAKDLEPSIRSCSCLDMLRTEPGAKYKPVVYDDGPLDANRPADLKAFLDVQEEEVLLWARWSSVKLVKAQHRCIVTNPLGEKPDVSALERVISHDAFVNLVAPAFASNMPEQDWMAISKRAFHVVFLRDRAFIRPPSETKNEVKQVMYPGGIADLLVESCKPTLSAYKRGDEPDGSLLDRNRRWSNLLVRKVMSGEKVDAYIADNLDAPIPVTPRPSLPEPNPAVASSSNVNREGTDLGLSTTAGQASSGSNQAGPPSDVQPAKRTRTGSFAWTSRLRPSQMDNGPVEIDLDSVPQADEIMHDVVPEPAEVADGHVMEDLLGAFMDEEDSDVVANESD